MWLNKWSREGFGDRTNALKYGSSPTSGRWLDSITFKGIGSVDSTDDVDSDNILPTTAQANQRIKAAKKYVEEVDTLIKEMSLLELNQRMENVEVQEQSAIEENTKRFENGLVQGLTQGFRGVTKLVERNESTVEWVDPVDIDQKRELVMLEKFYNDCMWNASFKSSQGSPEEWFNNFVSVMVQYFKSRGNWILSDYMSYFEHQENWTNKAKLIENGINAANRRMIELKRG